jgi:hypothetical protein
MLLRVDFANILYHGLLSRRAEGGSPLSLASRSLGEGCSAENSGARTGSLCLNLILEYRGWLHFS